MVIYALVDFTSDLTFLLTYYFTFLYVHKSAHIRKKANNSPITTFKMLLQYYQVHLESSN